MGQAARSRHRAALLLSSSLGCPWSPAGHLADGGLSLALTGLGWGGGPSRGAVPGPVGHLSFSDVLDTSLKVSWQEPGERNGILTGRPLGVANPGGEPGRKGSSCPSSCHLPSVPPEPLSRPVFLGEDSEEVLSPSALWHTPAPHHGCSPHTARAPPRPTMLPLPWRHLASSACPTARLVGT